MQVKAQGLLNAGKFVEQKFGPDALKTVLAQCSPGVRQTYESAIAINWHPAEELYEFVRCAEAKFGSPDGALAQAIGAASARINLKGVLLRIGLYVAKPSYLMTRIAGMWRQFNDEGAMELREMTSAGATIELLGLKEPNVVLCNILTGWTLEIARALDPGLVDAEHTLCRARGDARCIWQVRGKVPGMAG